MRRWMLVGFATLCTLRCWQTRCQPSKFTKVGQRNQRSCGIGTITVVARKPKTIHVVGAFYTGEDVMGVFKYFSRYDLL
ncbi:hypothetical protein BDM02DRAFT_3123101 [Thelephora ganbajun]|uniref:Uncharacterized protein n=1 Tax=Thelephora ganbajun TaxID=370292 RepID=A0ACB6Z2I4_THEGA|nr:hypothetical protein BDM02DRAFT_3123101 [Thelephora ganbajun]